MRSNLKMSSRRGLSLVEIMVALVLLGIVATGIMTVIMRQQQFYRSATEVIDTRSQIRQAAAVVPVDIRGVSSVSGDILNMSDSSLDVRGNIGSGLICSHTANSVTIPPINLANGRYFTTFLTRPKVSDVFMILDDKAAGNQDDDWAVPYVIASIDSTTVGCASFTDVTADAGKFRYVYTFTTNLSPTIVDGAPLRMARGVKYSIYKSASDGLWWMGYRECRGDGSSCDAVQPVSGPYKPYVPNDTINSGVSFVYRDSTGAITANKANVARVELFIHGQTQGAVALGGGKSKPYSDYMKVTIALRNRQ